MYTPDLQKKTKLKAGDKIVLEELDKPHFIIYFYRGDDVLCKSDNGAAGTIILAKGSSTTKAYGRLISKLIAATHGFGIKNLEDKNSKVVFELVREA